MKLLVALLVSAMVCGAQSQPVNQVQGAPPLGYQLVLTYSGTDNTYICYARSSQPTARTVTVSTVSNASPASLSATAHGFDYQSAATTTPIVKITGATAGWAGINGVWVATPTSANAFTIPLDTSAFGAFGAQVLVVTTYAPSTASLAWSIMKMVYDGSHNVIWTGWGASAPGAGTASLPAGSTADNLACASRTTYGYQ